MSLYFDFHDFKLSGHIDEASNEAKSSLDFAEESASAVGLVLSEVYPPVQKPRAAVLASGFEPKLENANYDSKWARAFLADCQKLAKKEAAEALACAAVKVVKSSSPDKLLALDTLFCPSHSEEKKLADIAPILSIQEKSELLDLFFKNRNWRSASWIEALGILKDGVNEKHLDTLAEIHADCDHKLRKRITEALLELSSSCAESLERKVIHAFLDKGWSPALHQQVKESFQNYLTKHPELGFDELAKIHASVHGLDTPKPLELLLWEAGLLAPGSNRAELSNTISKLCQQYGKREIQALIAGILSYQAAKPDLQHYLSEGTAPEGSWLGASCGPTWVRAEKPALWKFLSGEPEYANILQAPKDKIPGASLDLNDLLLRLRSFSKFAGEGANGKEIDGGVLTLTPSDALQQALGAKYSFLLRIEESMNTLDKLHLEKEEQTLDELSLLKARRQELLQSMLSAGYRVRYVEETVEIPSSKSKGKVNEKTGKAEIEAARFEPARKVTVMRPVFEPIATRQEIEEKVRGKGLPKGRIEGPSIADFKDWQKAYAEELVKTELRIKDLSQYYSELSRNRQAIEALSLVHGVQTLNLLGKTEAANLLALNLMANRRCEFLNNDAGKNLLANGLSKQLRAAHASQARTSPIFAQGEAGFSQAVEYLSRMHPSNAGTMFMKDHEGTDLRQAAASLDAGLGQSLEAAVLGHPKLAQLIRLSQDIAAHSHVAQSLFLLEQGRVRTPEAVKYMREQAALLEGLFSRCDKKFIEECRQVVAKLEFVKSQHLPASVQEKLNQLSSGLNALIERFDPESQGNKQLLLACKALKDGRFEDPKFWEQVLYVGAAIAVSSAVLASCGSSVPLLMLAMPAANFLTRDAVSELLRQMHQLGLTDRPQQGSDLIALLANRERVVRDENTGELRPERKTEIIENIARDYGQDLFVSLLLLGAGRAATSIGSRYRVAAALSEAQLMELAKASQPGSWLSRYLNSVLYGLGPGMAFSAGSKALEEIAGLDQLSASLGFEFVLRLISSARVPSSIRLDGANSKALQDLRQKNLIVENAKGEPCLKFDGNLIRIEAKAKTAQELVNMAEIDELMKAVKQARLLSKKYGLPEELLPQSIDFDDKKNAYGYYSVDKDRLVFKPGREHTSTMDHEVRHRANYLRLTAIYLADPKAVASAMLEDCLRGLGSGRRTILHQNNWQTELRPKLSEKQIAELKTYLRDYLKLKPAVSNRQQMEIWLMSRGAKVDPLMFNEFSRELDNWRYVVAAFINPEAMMTRSGATSSAIGLIVGLEKMSQTFKSKEKLLPGAITNSPELAKLTMGVSDSLVGRIESSWNNYYLFSMDEIFSRRVEHAAALKALESRHDLSSSAKIEMRKSIIASIQFENAIVALHKEAAKLAGAGAGPQRAASEAAMLGKLAELLKLTPAKHQKQVFEHLIEKGWVKPQDTAASIIQRAASFGKLSLLDANQSAVDAGPILEYRKKGTVKAELAKEAFNWTDWQGNPMRGEAGDMRVIQPSGNVSSVKLDIFKLSYSELPGKPGEYVKTAITKAQQLKQPLSIETLEGIGRGNAGDYLVTGPKGEKYIVAKGEFESMYLLLNK